MYKKQQAKTACLQSVATVYLTLDEKLNVNKNMRKTDSKMKTNPK